MDRTVGAIGKMQISSSVAVGTAVTSAVTVVASVVELVVMLTPHMDGSTASVIKFDSPLSLISRQHIKLDPIRSNKH